MCGVPAGTRQLEVETVTQEHRYEAVEPVMSSKGVEETPLMSDIGDAQRNGPGSEASQHTDTSGEALDTGCGKQKSSDCAALAAKAIEAQSENGSDSPCRRYCHSDSCEGLWANALQGLAQTEAKKHLLEGNLVMAEKVIAKVLACLLKRGEAGEAGKAALRLRRSTTFSLVLHRSAQYDAISKTLDPEGFQQIWWQDWGYLMFRRKVGQRLFEYKSVLFVDAPLTHVVACDNELDLLPKLQPDLIEAPRPLKPRNNARTVYVATARVLIFRVELLAETLRFCDHDFGFVAQRVSSNFPSDGVLFPKRRYQRVDAEVETLLIPRGGGQVGTIVLQQTRVDPRFWVPERVLTTFFRSFVPALLMNFKLGLEKIRNPREPWLDRISNDDQGLYAEVRHVEAVAAKRRTITLDNLPGSELFERPWRLSQDKTDLLQPTPESG